MADYIAPQKGRGRPKKYDENDELIVVTGPRQFTREYKDYTGHRSIWVYNLDITPHGPISVEEFYPGDTEESKTLEDLTGEHIPKTKRMYLNPANGKLVGYTRARNLNLIS